MWWITWDFIRMGNYCLEQRRGRVWKSFLLVFARDDAAAAEIRFSKHFCDRFFLVDHHHHFIEKIVGVEILKIQIKICQTYWIIPPLLEIPKFQIYPHLMVFYPYMWSTFKGPLMKNFAGQSGGGSWHQWISWRWSHASCYWNWCITHHLLSKRLVFPKI